MKLPNLVALWIPILIAFYIMRWSRKTQGAGIVSAYLVSFCGLYWIGGLIRLLPWFRDYFLVLTTYGLEQSTYAIAALATGSLFLSPLLLAAIPDRSAGVRYLPHPNLPKAYMVIGAISYVLLSTFLSSLPSMAAVIGAGQELYIVGLCLFCWNAIQRNNARGLLTGLGLALLMPLITIISQGFMGYGAAAALVVFAFAGSFFSRRKMLAVAVIACYCGLSVYVTYMRDRNEIRTAVWGGRSLENRLDRIDSAINTFEWFDLYNPVHLNRLDSRMNQDYLVGAAVYHLSASHKFAGGETLWGAILALVPRVIWPEKPVFAGSGDLVSRYTGIHFAEGTSVGAGQVLEFYVNFGTTGIIVGFLIFGTLVTVIDVIAYRRLLQGDHQGFVLWFVAGMSLLQSGGSLVEISASTAGGLVTVTLVNRYLIPSLQKKYFVPAAPKPSFSAARLRA